MRLSQARILLPLAALTTVSVFFTASGAEPKPDRKKSQAGLERGVREDEAGRRDAAIELSLIHI